MTKTEQKSDWFLAINPNGRIPAMTDTRPPSSVNSKEPMHLWESGSILLYLTTHYDPEYQISFPVGTKEYHDMLSWVFFQNAGMVSLLDFPCTEDKEQRVLYMAKERTD